MNSGTQHGHVHRRHKTWLATGELEGGWEAFSSSLIAEALAPLAPLHMVLLALASLSLS